MRLKANQLYMDIHILWEKIKYDQLRNTCKTYCLSYPPMIFYDISLKTQHIKPGTQNDS